MFCRDIIESKTVKVEIYPCALQQSRHQREGREGQF